MTSLPSGFETLEPFVAHWAVPTADERAGLRDGATPEALRSFYTATQPLMRRALDRLDGTPLAEHNDRERCLMRLMLAFAHVAMAVEVQGEDEPAHGLLRPHMRIVRAVADMD